jgi:hypothetical protein
MKISILIGALCAMTLHQPTFAQDAPDNLEKMDPKTEFFPLRVTARIVDESGQPIEGADIELGIANAGYRDEFKKFLGKSGADGTFSAESPAHAAYVRFVVTKKGYYTSRMNYEKFERMPEKLRILKRFEPWDPTVDIVLKKIDKPIPMFVRLGNYGIKEIPVLNEKVPFDLMAWDWLPPRGKGKLGDLVFQFELREESEKDYSVSMTMDFANEHDGLIPITELRGVESLLQNPRMAPETGYEIKTFRASRARKDDRITFVPDNPPMGYFIRIRTQVDSEGRIVSACYGKMVRTDLRAMSAPAIAVFPPYASHKTSSFKFASCYLNSTPNDRNLEYDQIHNLAPEVEPGFQWPP